MSIFTNIQWFNPKKERQKALCRFLARNKLHLEDFKTNAYNYICAFPSLAAQVNECSENIVRYYDRAISTNYQSRPYNILIIAPPGAGKSTLAKCLASELLKNIEDSDKLTDDKIDKLTKTHFDEFNLTRLETAVDLDNMLSTISTKAEKLKKSNFLGFFLLDECDSYFTFPFFQRVIMPIWDGYFYEKHGKEIKIPSCVLFFVISKLPKSRTAESMSRFFRGVKEGLSIKHLLQHQGLSQFWREDTLNYVEYFLSKFPKGADFYSRMVEKITIPSLYDPVRDEWWNEKSKLSSLHLDVIALSVNFITKKYFKGVNKVQKALLYYLAAGMGNIKSIRDLDNLFFKSLISKDDKFSYQQLPGSERNRFEQVIDDIPIPNSAYMTIIPM